MNTDSVSGLLLEEQKLGAISGRNEPPAAPGVEQKIRMQNVKIFKIRCQQKSKLKFEAQLAEPHTPEFLETSELRSWKFEDRP